MNEEEKHDHLVPMDDWLDKDTNTPHVAYRESESGDVLTASHRLDTGWYGSIKTFLEKFKKIREKLHLL